MPITLDLGSLSVLDVVAVAREGERVAISAAAKKAMLASRAVVERCLNDGEAHYGINTGFGSLSKQRISNDDLATLQLNLVRSHAAGFGAAFATDVVRATMLLLAASLCRGKSGVRPVVAESVVKMLNAGITPVVPETGSVGASGDLAPLAHIACALIGEGMVEHKGKLISAGKALAAAGIKPVALAAKEGLALINGTHLMAARGILICRDIDFLLDAALVGTAMSIEACRGSHAFLDERLYAARNQSGPAFAAERLRELLEGSQIVKSHAENDPRVQDPYSLRAAPTVLGAAIWMLMEVRQNIEAELGAVTDNPLVFADKGMPAIVSGANFHGMPLAIPLDIVPIAISHIAGIAERRVYLITGAFEPESNLKPYLAPRPGLESGLMIAQYTAAAACNEIVTLCMPASVANIPTSAGMEDYNSFGPRAAAKAARALELARGVVAIELLCAAEAMEYHRPHTSGKGVEAAHKKIRTLVPRLKGDRSPSPDIAAIANLIQNGAFSVQA